jgi:biopolymer transport protein ExbB/TolQ
MLTQRILQLNLLGAEWVNWLLLAVSFVGNAIFVDRLLLFWRTRERFPELRARLEERLRASDVSGALVLVGSDSMVREVLRAGLSAVDRGERRPMAVQEAMLAALAAQRVRYESRLSALSTIGNVAPLVGLLGTIIGIVGAFEGLARSGAAQAAGNAFVMRSIAEALATTAVGILVAVPAVVAFNWFKSALAARQEEAESGIRTLLAWLEGGTAKGTGAP